MSARVERKAQATWRGDLESGRGEISSASGVLSGNRYSFSTRFEDGEGTNPEELLGAAHAGCYSMALAELLANRGMDPERIDTVATVGLGRSENGFGITGVHLETRVEAPGADPARFEDAVNDAKSGCIVSGLFDTDIEVDATLVH